MVVKLPDQLVTVAVAGGTTLERYRGGSVTYIRLGPVWALSWAKAKPENVQQPTTSTAAHDLNSLLIMIDPVSFCER